MAKSRNGMIIFFREGDIIGQGCGVGTFLFDPYNSAGQWGGNVTGDPAEAVLSADHFTFKLNAGSVDSTFVLTQFHFMRITGGTYYAFHIPRIEIAGGSGTGSDKCETKIEYTIDAGVSWTSLIDLIPTFVVDYARFVSGALPIGVGERFAIRISCHLLSPDALQPTITVRLPVSYCCPGDPVFAPDMSNMDVSQPEDDDAPTYYRQVLNIPDEISNFIYTPTSWTMSGTAGVEIVPKDHGGIFPLEALADLGPTCRYFVFDVDVSSGPSCVVSIELTYYHNDGTVGAHTFLKEDGTFTPFDYFIPAGFTGHITSVQLSASALRYIGLTVVLQTAGSESASVSNPTYSPQITDTFYWVNEGT